VKRPVANANEGSTPALGDAQARKLLEAPPGDTLKGVRHRAILATCSITVSAPRSSAGIGNVLRHDYEHVAHDELRRLVCDELSQLEKVCREEPAAVRAREKQQS
jgi:hypothetical protein